MKKTRWERGGKKERFCKPFGALNWSYVLCHAIIYKWCRPLPVPHPRSLFSTFKCSCQLVGLVIVFSHLQALQFDIHLLQMASRSRHIWPLGDQHLERSDCGICSPDNVHYNNEVTSNGRQSVKLS